METSTKKPSLPASVEKYVGQIWGTPAKGDRIPINTPMHKSQRPYKKQNVYKYIAKVEGLDWNLFGYATAVKRKSDGELAVINAQHRINLVKIVAPWITEVPAHIIEVDDEQFEVYASELFSQFNGTVSKGLSNEELYYSQVLAKDPQALDMQRVLINCGLSCGEVNKSPSAYPVVYATFVKCLKIGENPAIRAVELLIKGFKTVADDPLHGLTFLLGQPEYSVLGDPTTKIGQDFELWFTQAVPTFHSVNDLKFKKYRNNPSWQKGIAYGLMKSFAKYQRNHSKTAPPKLASIKKIYEDGFKDEDSGMLE
jgi:hypothetical protein